jgi:hypothetical protein
MARLLDIWGEYALERDGEWWHGDALPPDYRVRRRRATHDDVARAVSPSDLLEAAARNGISLATRVRQ